MRPSQTELLGCKFMMILELLEGVVVSDRTFEVAKSSLHVWKLLAYIPGAGHFV